MKKTLGGDRLGSGKRMQVGMEEYGRSTHDLSFVWRSTASAGTLIPFMTELALPGDTWDIDLNCDVLTHPTIGPLFGTYKIQLDVFEVPIRLYQAGLHMNMVGIGMEMENVMLPQINIKGQMPRVTDENLDNLQINPSSIFKYLGISGLGANAGSYEMHRNFNAVPYLGYWEIYKQYYSNKQEGVGAVIHKVPGALVDAGFLSTLMQFVVADGTWHTDQNPWDLPTTGTDVTVLDFRHGTEVILEIENVTEGQISPEDIIFTVEDSAGNPVEVDGTVIFKRWTWDEVSGIYWGSDPWYDGPNWPGNGGTRSGTIKMIKVALNTENPALSGKPYVEFFDLKNIDAMRIKLLKQDYNVPYVITDAETLTPYKWPLANVQTQFDPSPIKKSYSTQFAQEGLALKTYTSDLFQNWLDTEWIDGVDGISAVTAVSTTGDSFTIDELNLKSKIYIMLNRIAISGGTYDDWLDAVYTQQRQRSVESPVYQGGLIQTLVFQEVIGMAASENQPLGTLAGRGRVSQGRKGGKIIIKSQEPSYIIGIFSLTPNIDYSQGNKWDMNLKTLDDLHKPALDEIGFQDLITDQFAWWDTTITPGNKTFKSAGKQPAWVNYMTNVNKVYGNFADANQQMFMVLNRRYEVDWNDVVPTIKDLTTYIDPSKFNHIFADTSISGQNFWVQIGANIEARRVMSAKVIPNL